MKHWLFFLLLLFTGAEVLAQKKLKKDSAYIELRSLNKNTLAELKNTREFQYNTSNEPPQSLWDKFWNWVWWKIGQLLSTKGGRTTVWSVLVTLAIIVVVFFVVRVAGMEQGGLFGRSDRRIQKYTLSQDDIHRISFDEAIDQSIKKGNYRLAIRLHYLQILKILSDRGDIEWRINKTNMDYLAEIKGKPFHDLFTRLTLHFEYFWYGVKELTPEQFSTIRREFQQFNNEVA